MKSIPRICLFLYALLLATACSDPDITPAPFAYPLALTADQKDHSVDLNWTQVDVSSFEEYIILRSIDSIPDTPEPEVSGLTAIVARIDQRTKTTFTDFQLPIESDVYYKVYARIGGRFLMSPTRHVGLNFQVIDFRADVMAADTAHDEIVGFDRARDLLFRYNYEEDEVQASELYTLNTPIIRFGQYQGKDEVYLCDRNSVIFIADRESLHWSHTINTAFNVLDFVVVDELIIVTRSNGTIAVYDRAQRQQRSTVGSVTINPRFLAAASTGDNVVTVWEFALTQVARYRITGWSLGIERMEPIVVAGSAVLLSPRPDYLVFAMSNFGQIMDANLEPVTALEGGSNFYQGLTFSPDGTRLFTAGFGVENAEIKMFDVTADYALDRVYPFSFTPTNLFADEGTLYSTAVLFVNGAARTLISKIDYQ
ncbi:MAG: WD40 repeat domain-containing protein [Saprospiraceae bacterium]|nr:WD40 repeat domain-containing protein [Saprospiraceae bacterium]